jgi:hypothetical protein
MSTSSVADTPARRLLLVLWRVLLFAMIVALVGFACVTPGGVWHALLRS